MGRPTFEEVRSRVLNCGTPYDASALYCMKVDIECALEDAGFRIDRPIKETEDLVCMLEVACVPNSVPVTEMHATLERAWLKRAAFKCEAHAVNQVGDEIRLDFVTWWNRARPLYVTGRIVAHAEHRVPIGGSSSNCAPAE